jgi:predicted RND superfamily exporter protein
MGLLMAFMFLVNMLAARILLPALASVFLGNDHRRSRSHRIR